MGGFWVLVDQNIHHIMHETISKYPKVQVLEKDHEGKNKVQKQVAKSIAKLVIGFSSNQLPIW